ncbi:MAG: hypothetical protein WD119_02445, partial [Pirellulaceae bacterium]
SNHRLVRLTLFSPTGICNVMKILQTDRCLSQRDCFDQKRGVCRKFPRGKALARLFGNFFPDFLDLAQNFLVSTRQLVGCRSARIPLASLLAWAGCR